MDVPTTIIEVLSLMEHTASVMIRWMWMATILVIVRTITMIDTRKEEGLVVTIEGMTDLVIAISGEKRNIIGDAETGRTQTAMKLPILPCFTLKL